MSGLSPDKFSVWDKWLMSALWPYELFNIQIFFTLQEREGKKDYEIMCLIEYQVLSVTTFLNFLHMPVNYLDAIHMKRLKCVVLEIEKQEIKKIVS